MKRPLVVAVENKWLQQLQDRKHVAEKGHVVLLPKLNTTTVQETCDHRQVSGGEQRKTVSRLYPLLQQKIVYTFADSIIHYI